MSKLIAVLCVDREDFIKHVSNKQTAVDIINGCAFTSSGEKLIAIHDNRGYKGLRFYGYETTESFDNAMRFENNITYKDLITVVKTRVVK